MLTIRKRGRFWHIRGTVKVGQDTRTIREHSTGCDQKEDAHVYKTKLEQQTREELLYGSQGRAKRMTIADAFYQYIERPGGVKSHDLWRVGQIGEVIGDYSIADAKLAWKYFVSVRCRGLKPATIDRFRAVLVAAMNYATEGEDFDAPRIKLGIRYNNERVRFLTIEEQDRLLSSYADHVQPIATTLCFQGMRIGEAMRIEWQHVRWAENELYIMPETKSRQPRTVFMQEPVRQALHRLWIKRGSRKSGKVFLNRSGDEYADPRDLELPGGTPIDTPHQTACRRAGIDDFRVHDWRHHWASWCVMSGIDLETIRVDGGWSSLRMVQRYARVSAQHRIETMKKLKIVGK